MRAMGIFTLPARQRRCYESCRTYETLIRRALRNTSLLDAPWVREPYFGESTCFQEDRFRPLETGSATSENISLHKLGNHSPLCQRKLSSTRSKIHSNEFCLGTLSLNRESASLLRPG